MQRVGTAMLLVAGVISGREATGQLRDGATVSYRLADGTAVTLMRVESLGEENHRYRYLPASLSIAKHRDGSPEFSFLTYKKDEGGEVDGGIMHLLLRWGLTEKQTLELQRILRSKVDSAGLVDGAASVLPADGDSSWEITRTGPVGSVLNRAVASAGHVPTVPENKMALSFRFDATGAKQMSEILRRKRGAWGEKIRFLFTYNEGVRDPADEGSVWVLDADLGTLLPRTGK